MLFLTPPKIPPPPPPPVLGGGGGGILGVSFLTKFDKAWRARQPGRRRSGTIRVASPQATWHKPVSNGLDNY